MTREVPRSHRIPYPIYIYIIESLFPTMRTVYLIRSLIWITTCAVAIDVDPSASGTSTSQSSITAVVLQIEPNQPHTTTNEEFVTERIRRKLEDNELNSDDTLVEQVPVPPLQIVDGTTVLRGEFPAFAYLSGIGCGATLIHYDIVLTAAHCVVDQISSSTDNISRFFGDVFLGGTKRDGSDAMETFRVINVQSHPNYNLRNYPEYDYTLLQLSRSSSITPIPYNRNASLPYDSTELITMGHGVTAIRNQDLSYNLLQVRVNAINVDTCLALYFEEFDITSTMCAAAKGKDSCSGDSGGPLLLRNTINVNDTNVEPTYTLVGIVSGGSGCALDEYPGLYARVSTVADTFLRNGICDMSQFPPSDCPPKSNTTNNNNNSSTTVCPSCVTNVWLGSRFGSGRRMYLYNAQRNTCREKCRSNWSVFLWKLLGWKCGATCPS
jgi:Trypsin